MNKVVKPWGHYIDIFRSPTMVMKILVIKPGHRISLQKHAKRKEYWGVDQGEGRLTFGQTESIIFPSNSVFIPENMVHRVANIGNDDLIIYETQIGICDENDIERLEDDYGKQRL